MNYIYVYVINYFSYFIFKGFNIGNTRYNTIYLPSPIEFSVYGFSNYIFIIGNYDLIGNLSCGGLAMIDRSRIPEIAICNVLGIGVAVKVKTWTLEVRLLIFSFCNTPNLCSSSITNNAKLLNLILSDNKEWVPIIMSVSPLESWSTIIFFLVWFC